MIGVFSSASVNEDAEAQAVGGTDAERVPLLPYDFNSKLYLEINTDVADAGIEAAVHYVYQGIKEGRAYRYPTPEEIAAAEQAEAEAART